MIATIHQFSTISSVDPERLTSSCCQRIVFNEFRLNRCYIVIEINTNTAHSKKRAGHEMKKLVVYIRYPFGFFLTEMRLPIRPMEGPVNQEHF